MSREKKVVLKCLLCMAVFSLTACGEKEVAPQEIQESPKPVPMAEANLSTETEENITDIQDANSIKWDELLKVPTDKAKEEANPENRMAHNVYVDPDLSATSGKFDGFMIDFKADKAGMATYWVLCNWQMNKEDLMGKYDVMDAYASAYAGLQMRREPLSIATSV